MEAQYEIRLLSEKVAVMNEVDGGPKKNLIMVSCYACVSYSLCFCSNVYICSVVGNLLST